ncbi:MAG: helix-turn-helix domain-containing protein [Caulobacteraceae bacterium]
MVQAAVPSFFLYGEPPRTVDPRFLHVEALGDRSRPSEWTIGAHAHGDLHHLFLIRSGAGRLIVEGTGEDFAGPNLLLVPAGCVHGFIFEPETAGLVLTIAAPFFAEMTTREPDFADLFAAAMALDVSEDADDMTQLLGRIGRELAWTAPGRASAVEGALLSVLVIALRRLRRAAPHAALAPSRQAELVARFRAMVEQGWSTRRPTTDYAARLGVTTWKLRAACLDVTGEGPLDLLQSRVVLEAKRLLIYSGLSVSQVAYAVGYDDPAYFSRVFARRVGSSPAQFRREAGSAPVVAPTSAAIGG